MCIPLFSLKPQPSGKLGPVDVSSFSLLIDIETDDGISIIGSPVGSGAGLGIIAPGKSTCWLFSSLQL